MNILERLENLRRKNTNEWYNEFVEVAYSGFVFLGQTSVNLETAGRLRHSPRNQISGFLLGQIKMNTCSKCGITKSSTEFNKEPLNINGLSSWCKECKNKQSALWRSKNRDKDCARKEKYYAENRLSMIEKACLWAKENVEKKHSHYKNRRAKLNGSSGNVTAGQWKEILDKYGNKCLRCGTTERLSQDHVVPLELGGLHSVDNLQPLCRSCNSKKHTKIIDYRIGAK